MRHKSSQITVVANVKKRNFSIRNQKSPIYDNLLPRVNLSIFLSKIRLLCSKSRKLQEFLCTEMTLDGIRLTTLEKYRDQGERKTWRFWDQVYGQHKTTFLQQTKAVTTFCMPIKALVTFSNRTVPVSVRVCVRPSNSSNLVQSIIS